MSGVVADTHLPVTVLKTEAAHRGFRNVDVITYREDESGLEARREIVVARHAVAVIAYDPKRARLVMVRQFRLGAQMGTGKGFCTEVVAGLIDDGEQPHESAHRELVEETGLQASRIELICSFLTSPGMSDELIHLYYAETDSTMLPQEAGAVDEAEQTFPFTLTLDEALTAVDENSITNGIAMVALLTFARHRKRLTGEAS